MFYHWLTWIADIELEIFEKQCYDHQMKIFLENCKKMPILQRPYPKLDAQEIINCDK